MELIPLVIVGLVILVLVVKASSNQSTPQPTEQPITGTMEVAPDIRSEPTRFDATSAQQVKELKVLEGAAYVTDGSPFFERIHASEGAFNQAVFYRGNLLHSGIIDNNADLPADPRTGRLTINAFFRPIAPKAHSQ